MKFKSYYIYILLISITVITFRNNFDFTLGDRNAFTNEDFFQENTDIFKNVVAQKIFSYSKNIGEIIFSILYYRNTFILSNLICKLSPLKETLNSKILNISVLLSLLSPITILFTSFAGKDIITILLSSMFCIYSLKTIQNLKFNLIDMVYLLSLFLLIINFRELTGIFTLLLIISFIIFYTNLVNQTNFIILFLLISTIIFQNFEGIYLFAFELFRYQAAASVFDVATLRNINPFFQLSVYFENYYQAFTGVNLIHFNDSFIKSIALLLNAILNYFFGIFFNFLYWYKKKNFNIYIIIKIIFFGLYFSLFAFLSQNNPGGAVRYYSSIIPILVTFSFIIVPKNKILSKAS